MTGGSHACLGGLALERYLLGELDDAGRSRIEDALAACPRCAERLARLREDEAAFALRPVPPALRELWTAPRRRKVPWLRVAGLAAPLVAAAAVLLVVAIPVGGPGAAGKDEAPPGIGGRSDPETLRGKGPGTADAGAPSLALGFYVLGAGGEPALGRPGQVLRQGDRIQFWYAGTGGREGAAVLVGIDGRGSVTRYLPRGGAAARLVGGDGHLLDSAVLLDDARGPERFFLCVGPEVSASRVEAAAREAAVGGGDLARLDRLPLDCDQATVWIVKE